MLNGLERVVDAAGEGIRVDRFVRGLAPGSTRALVLEAVGVGSVRVNGARAAKGDRLRAGDRVEVLELAEARDVRVEPNPDLPLCVVAETAALLALDKPAGQPVHPLSRLERDTLANALVARHPCSADLGGEPLMAGIVHRIDTGTSGLVLAARTAGARAALVDRFRRQAVGKTYLALCAGDVSRGAELRDDLYHDPAFRGRMLRAAAGRPPGRERLFPAVTRFEPLGGDGRFTLLRVVIRTGVTHQVRCQLAGAGRPLAGDALYGGPEPPPGAPPRAGHWLHALGVAFDDPPGDVPPRLVAPAPAAFRPWLEAAGLGADGGEAG